MTIRSVTPIALDLPFEVGGPKSQFAGRPRQMAMLLVRVETEDGIVGWGEAFGYAVWPVTRVAIEKLIAPMAVGKSEDDIDGLMHDLQKKLHLLGRTGPVVYAMSGLDIALWDIAGKKANQSLSMLFGASRRSSLPAYASLVRYEDTKLVARNAELAVSRGFKAIKLHEVAVQQVKAAREAIGASIRLMMDTNCPWTVEEAIAVAKQVRPYDLMWFEEPVFPPEDFTGLARVRRDGGIAVAAGENAMSEMDFRAMIAAGAVDYMQPSVTKIGGITEMMRIFRLARERNVKLVPHSPYFGPGLLATLHMANTVERDTLIEYSFVELGASPLGEAVAVKDGRIAIPQGPGLGCDPDPKIVARYKVD
ncbi:MAG: mandelate racemase/muconate lactonizing enzyme family protein [Betaproteobacteria bacterium]|nr:mandelate racemase/muconate lactonizing enzyme family protein [Betaproteobacteria bacterium]